MMRYSLWIERMTCQFYNDWPEERLINVNLNNMYFNFYKGKFIFRKYATKF
jgi:hypothetical protein